MKAFKGITPLNLLIAVLAAAVWMAAGTVKRTGAGESLPAALLAELPLTAVIFVLSLLWARLRRP